MRKFWFIIVIVAVSAMFTACGGRKGAPSEDGAMRVVLGVGNGDGDSKEYVDTDEPVYTPTPTPTSSPTPTVAVKPTTSVSPVSGSPEPTDEPTGTPDQKGTFVRDDCAVTVNGVTIRPHMDFLGKEDSVGKVVDKLEGVSCMDSGYDINYYYDGFIIDTITQNGKQLVYMANFSGGDAKTLRDIGISSSADDVIAAYGEPTEDSGVSLAYIVEEIQMMFYLEDDVVSEIVIVDTSFQ